MIEAIGLQRRFGQFIAVDNLSLRVPEGTIVALLGPNGAGKTTTVRMLTGLLAPSSGEATVAGFNVQSDPSAVRARVGLVTDVPGLHEQMTVPSYLDFFGSMNGMSPSLRARRIDELLRFFDLEEYRKQRMVGFSKGMKQKVALARALLHEPPALFLDEPTSGLDPSAARAVREMIIALKNASRSIVLCTHNFDEAERLADQVVILRRGRIVACDAPATLRLLASPDTTVQIRLAAPCPAALATLVSRADVIAPVVLPMDAAKLTTLEYRTLDPTTVNPPVLARLIAVGAHVISVSCTTRTLEEVYMDAITASDSTSAWPPSREEVSPSKSASPLSERRVDR